MTMRTANGIVALMLAVATALLAQFYLGSKEQHDQAMVQHFWQELNLRFIFCGVAGLIGAAFWWVINWLLRQVGLVREINLRKTAFLLMSSIVSSSLIGALLFCLL